MLAPEQEANWSIRVGGEYGSNDLEMKRVVTCVDGDRVYYQLAFKHNNRRIAKVHACNMSTFRQRSYPEDASPLPALVKALLAAHPLIVANSPEEQIQVLKQIDAALIAAGEKV